MGKIPNVIPPVLIKRVQICTGKGWKKQRRPRGCTIREWTQVYSFFKDFIWTNQIAAFFIYCTQIQSKYKVVFRAMFDVWTVQDVSRCSWYNRKVCRNSSAKFVKNDFGILCVVRTRRGLDGGKRTSLLRSVEAWMCIWCVYQRKAWRNKKYVVVFFATECQKRFLKVLCVFLKSLFFAQIQSNYCRTPAGPMPLRRLEPLKIEMVKFHKIFYKKLFHIECI